MPTARLNWERPTTRKSGRALAAADIAGFKIEASHDGGAFVTLPDSPPSASQRDLDVDVGDWRFRVSCFDTKNKVGDAGVGSVSIPDDSPPGAVFNVTVAIMPATQSLSS